METIAQRALRLLEPLPADTFIAGYFTDKCEKGCVIGLYTRLTSENPKDYSTENCKDDFRGELRNASSEFFKTIKNDSCTDISDVNNKWGVLYYPQDGVKDRVIACLKDMVAAGY